MTFLNYLLTIIQCQGWMVAGRALRGNYGSADADVS